MGWDALWGLKRLLGSWRLERVIPGQGAMSGGAVFEAASEGHLLYVESGALTLLDGTILRGEQQYLYEPIEGGFAVLFHGSEELFETVIPVIGVDGAWVGRADHRCKDDLYASEYLFREDGTFAIRHAVRGPRKDYVIHTSYVRD